MKKLLRAIVSLGCIVATVVYAQSSLPLDAGDFLRSTSAELVTRYDLHRLSSSTEVEAEISRAVDALHSNLSPSVQIWICHGCGTAAHPQLGIIVDVDEVLAMQRKSHVSDLHWLLIFVLAHEYGHQQQYRARAINVATLRTEEQRVYEAQADVLGAEAAYACLPQPSVPPALMSTLNQVLRAIYDSGGGEYTLSDHPSRAGRLLATQIGLMHAAVLDATAERLVGAEEFRQAIDLRDGEEAFPYTLRLARAIVQSNHAAAKNLVYVPKDDDVAWDKRNAHPVVSYNFRYENRGKKALIVSLQVKILGLDRQDPENVFKKRSLRSRSHDFRLEPGASYQVQGELNWSNTAGLMPRIIHPPDPLSLIEVHYADGTDLPEDESTSASGRTAYVSVAEKNSLLFGLNQLIRASASGYSGIAAGVGSAFSTGTVEYPSSIALAGSFSATVSASSVTSTFAELYDEKQAKASYEHLVEAVRSALPEIPTVDKTHVWAESQEADRTQTAFRHAPYSVVVEDLIIPVPTGPSQTVNVHHIQLTFTGQRLHPMAANNAGRFFTDPPAGKERDPDLERFLVLAAQHQLGQLRNLQDSDENEAKTWPAKGVADRFGTCKIELSQGEHALRCRHDFSTITEANTFVRSLQVGALNGGADLDYAVTNKWFTRVQMRGKLGSTLELRVWFFDLHTTMDVWAFSP